MRSVFGFVALMVTIAAIFYFVSLQFTQFEASESGSVSEDVRAGRVGDPAGMIETIDMADDAARAIEVKNRIPEDLLR